MAVHFFYGEEDFNIEQEINKFKKKLAPEFFEMSYKKYSHPKFADFIAILRSQPMMFGKMLIVIEVDFSFDDTQVEQIEQALNDCSEDIDIILTAGKVDGRKKLFKVFAKHNAREFARIPTYKTAELTAWINKQGVKLTTGAANALIMQVGNNLRQLSKELEKLQLYGKDVVTEDMVREICVNNEDLFGFTDLLMEDKRDAALLEYRKLLGSRHPLSILATLHTQTRAWIDIKAGGTGGMHEYRAKLTGQKLANTPLARLVALKKNLTDAEYKIKSGQVLDLEQEIENAIIFR
jgi:DNA polymerase III delta subunit